MPIPRPTGPAKCPHTLREVVAQAIYDAPNGIDGDQVGDMLIEDFRIEGETPKDCVAMVEEICRHAADAAIAALEAAGYVVAPIEPTQEMVEAAANSNTMRLVARALYEAMLTARPA